MITLISVCSYLFYAHKDSILNLVGLNNKEQENRNDQNKVKNAKIKKSLNGEKTSLSDSDMCRKKFILRTYSDVDFHIKLHGKKMT
ncbi:conserved Plasmodium protein, unknown function [Plasmodium malariae]|uniref:Uncharacterized protein n=1 Tax=Plasmodium malariae TaxID=5858 RepID=A0A1A8WB66_PLAMA|nr:conserved Plasmodium protein, unknown function [Plasmodium malariae]SBS90095.1 hypothetical protein PMALA_028580 [Plasmodium malariae]SBT80604.1 conserved Plasmodium protein, unknown function [Plasmodium malariae]SCP03188.1 conserved Plasmodium protein, unknown function [Plasmodium malariae]